MTTTRVETHTVTVWRAVNAELASISEPPATMGEMVDVPFDCPTLAAAWIVLGRGASVPPD